MNIVLFGAPGSGKGTQSGFLVSKLGMVQISTGDLLRANIRSGTELGFLAKNFMDKGELVPDSVVIEMVREFLGNGSKNFVLDGFPRTIAQAEQLDSLLGEMCLELGKVIFLEVPNEILVDRLCGRRVCTNCNLVYHISSHPPVVPDICDSCGSALVQRNDDRLDVIRNRLNAYIEFTNPLKDFYLKKGKLVKVDGNREVGVVFREIEGLIGK